MLQIGTLRYSRIFKLNLASDCAVEKFYPQEIHRTLDHCHATWRHPCAESCAGVTLGRDSFQISPSVLNDIYLRSGRLSFQMAAAEAMAGLLTAGVRRSCVPISYRRG